MKRNPMDELDEILNENNIAESKEQSILKPLFDAFGQIFDNYSKNKNNERKQ